MNREEQQFLELLKAGLWGREPDKNLFIGEIGWDSIWVNSKKQMVIGVVWDGVKNLPEEMIGKDISTTLQFNAIRVEEANKFQLEELSKFFTQFKRHGLNPVLLKGQGLAKYYLDPYRRQPGDFDILACDISGYKKICDILTACGATKLNHESIQHSTYCLKRNIIENHKMTQPMISPFSNKRWRSFEKAELWKEEDYLAIEDNLIRIPPVDYNVCYIFNHAFQHLTRGGVGLKQFCDWARYIYVNRDRIDQKKVIAVLKEIGLLQAASLFEEFNIEYLGFPEEMRLFDRFEDRILIDKLLEDILSSGNFGQADVRKRREMNFIGEKINSYKINRERKRQYYSIGSSETKWLLPYSIYINIANMLLGITNKIFNPWRLEN